MTAEPRRRDSAATRAALLDAATALFAERGFDHTTVRDIAARAGVNQALLFRYFGSKDALYASVMAGQGRELLDDSAGRLLEGVLRRLLETGPRQANHLLFTALQPGGMDNAAAGIREELGDDYVRALSTLTDAENGELRAELVLGWVVGISMLRASAHRDVLRRADTEEVIRLVLGAACTLLERTEQ
ncbi:TetR family transcriptional regulator [Umezawaea tangerina]|uniref:TetR family transcriptional regulator n=1 Tax=Umezawaea tangerina TaxID=84725 RepID=A0A2T0SS21_9PSEU|nr:TetR family transcriptional regulator [Umezawaea tangerina]PRY36200.1 TetR family transcriptional regulator [Umezawaea tangerina]